MWPRPPNVKRNIAAGCSLGRARAHQRQQPSLHQQGRLLVRALHRARLWSCRARRRLSNLEWVTPFERCPVAPTVGARRTATTQEAIRSTIEPIKLIPPPNPRRISLRRPTTAPSHAVTPTLTPTHHRQPNHLPTRVDTLVGCSRNPPARSSCLSTASSPLRGDPAAVGLRGRQMHPQHHRLLVHAEAQSTPLVQERIHLHAPEHHGQRQETRARWRTHRGSEGYSAR